jgi:predicted phage replisome organizer
MAENGKYYWLKLRRDFFKRHDIRIIEEMPNGKDYILFYLKLLLESIDHEGSLRFSDTIPYNEQMLSVVTNTNIDIVRSAMKLFIELNMMSIYDDQTIYMNEVEKLIGSETKWAEYKRNKKISVNELPQLSVCKRISYEKIQLPNGKMQYVDEKRYGCNGGLAFDRAGGKCEICGSEENLVIHHNNGYSNDLEDLLVCCKKCHGKLENVQSKSKTLPIELETEIKKEINIYTTTTTTEAPTLSEVYMHFRNNLDDEYVSEAEKFHAYNANRGWDCLPDWQTTADLWIARIGEHRRTGNA